MDNLKDLIFRYCILFGRRFFYKEKISFLRIISKELIQLGYNVDAKLAKLKLAKKRYENYYNAYIGDLDNADVIVCTYYDTGINYYNLSKKYAFEQYFDRTRYFIGLLPILILFVIAVLLSYFVFVPNIQRVGFLSMSGILLVLSTLLLSYFIIKFKNGVPNKKNFVCNTSSILIILNLVKKLDKKNKKKIAFVLCDAGCSNQYGLKMFEQYSDKIKQKKVIFLDSLGNSDSLIVFKSESFTDPVGISPVHESFYETAFKKHLLVSSGDLDTENRVLIKNAYSRSDKNLPVDIIEKHTDSLLTLLLTIISK